MKKIYRNGVRSVLGAREVEETLMHFFRSVSRSSTVHIHFFTGPVQNDLNMISFYILKHFISLGMPIDLVLATKRSVSSFLNF